MKYSYSSSRVRLVPPNRLNIRQNEIGVMEFLKQEMPLHMILRTPDTDTPNIRGGALSPDFFCLSKPVSDSRPYNFAASQEIIDLQLNTLDSLPLQSPNCEGARCGPGVSGGSSETVRHDA